MDNIVTINNTKNNVLDFDISIQGLSTDDIRVWFDIKTGNMDLRFECSKTKDDGWEVTIPPLPFIDKTAYSCSVSVVADGYFFEPMVGTLNVTGSADVYVKSTSNQTLKPSEDSEEKEDASVAASTPNVTPLADRPKLKMGERSIAQVAQDMLKAKDGDKKTTKKTKKDSETGKFTTEDKADKNASVKAVLAELRSKKAPVQKSGSLSEAQSLAASILNESTRPKFRKKT